MSKRNIIPVRNVRIRPLYEHKFIAENLTTGESIEGELLSTVLRAVRDREDNHPWLHGNQIRSLILYDGEFKFKSSYSKCVWRISLMRWIKANVSAPIPLI